MVYCWIPFCTSKHGKTQNVSFHEIPSDSVLRAKWLKVISRKDVPGPGGKTVICSLHFSPEDFDPNRKRKVLLKDSVPSILPGYPKYMQPPKKKLRPPRSRRKCSIEKNNASESTMANFQEISQVSVETSPNECYRTQPPRKKPRCSSSRRKCPVEKNGAVESTRPNLQESSQVSVETTRPNECYHMQPSRKKPRRSSLQRKCPVGKNGTVESTRPNLQEINQVDVETGSPNECYHTNPTTDACVQVDFIRKEKIKEALLLKKRLYHSKKTLVVKNTELKSLQQHIRELKNDQWYIRYQDIMQKAAEGEPSALFLLDQIKNFNLLKPLWSESTIRYSTVIRNCSPKCYDTIRANKILKLPSRATLLNYIGEKGGDTFNDKANEDELALFENHQSQQLVANEDELAVFENHQSQQLVTNED